jgi:Tfp pilus assembly protein PilZ
VAANDSPERRQHERHRVFRIEVKVATTSAFRASYLRDVSSGGIFVRSQKPLPKGTRVVVELGVASTPPLRIPGEVVRLEPTGFGVRFDELTREQQLGVNALVAMAAAPKPAGDDLETLRKRLAEAEGQIEGYEQALATAREHEMEVVQRAEHAEFERTLFEKKSRELSDTLAIVEAERSRLAQSLQVTTTRLLALDADQRAWRAKQRLGEDGRRDELVARLETERDQAQKVSQALESELERLRTELSAQTLDETRRELKVVTEELSDEKLKNMALQRAFGRFVAMGGKHGVNG